MKFLWNESEGREQRSLKDRLKEYSIATPEDMTLALIQIMDHIESITPENEKVYPEFTVVDSKNSVVAQGFLTRQAAEEYIESRLRSGEVLFGELCVRG